MWGEWNAGRWIPLTKASNAESASVTGHNHLKTNGSINLSAIYVYFDMYDAQVHLV